MLCRDLEKDVHSDRPNMIVSEAWIHVCCSKTYVATFRQRIISEVEIVCQRMTTDQDFFLDSTHMCVGHLLFCGAVGSEADVQDLQNINVRSVRFGFLLE